MAIPINPNGTINFDRVFNLYRGSEAKPVHNQKEYDAAVSEGFGAWTPVPYPYRVYNEDGVARDVKSEEEEQSAATEGFLRGRLHVKVAPKAPESAAPAFVPHNDPSGAIQALEQRTNQQAADIAAIKEMLEQLTKPAKKKGE